MSPACAAAGAPISATEMISRAKAWLTASNGGPVPYGQDLHWADGYRQDCSGYVSMAARIDAPGQRTVELATATLSSSASR